MPAPKGHPNYDVEGKAGRPKIYTDEWIENEAPNFEEWVDLKDSMFLEAYCLSRKIPERQFYEFVKKNERFRNAYEIFQLKQKLMLFTGSLSRKMFHTMCALLLSHKYNINQKNEQKITADQTASFIFGNVNDTTADLINESSTESN